MRKGWAYLFPVVLISLIWSGAVPAHSSDKADLVLSIKLEPDTFKECPNPLCKLLTTVYEKCSDDLRQLTLSAHSEPVSVNIHITHETSRKSCSWNFWDWLKAPFSQETEKSASQEDVEKSISQEDIDGHWEGIARNVSKERAENILRVIRGKTKLNTVDGIEIISADSEKGEFLVGSVEYGPLTPYTKDYGFLNRDKLIGNLKSLYNGNFAVLGGKRFVFTTNIDTSAPWVVMSKIRNETLFSSKSLAASTTGESMEKLEEELTQWFYDKLKQGKPLSSDERIKAREPDELQRFLQDIAKESLKENKGRFRFFFKTRYEGCYVVAEMGVNGEKDEDVTCYLAVEKAFELLSDGSFKNLLNLLEENIKIFDHDIEFSLLQASERLEDKGISLDDCLKIFVEQLVRENAPSNVSSFDAEKPSIFNKAEKELAKKILNRHSWLRSFLEAGALERIDSIGGIRDVDYFTEGNLTFCKVFSNSPSNYGFLDRSALKEEFMKIYAGRLSVNGRSAFTFRVDPDKADWERAAESLSEGAFFSINTIKPTVAQPDSNDAKGFEDFDVKRYFFRTDHDGLSLVVVNRKDDSSLSFYLASKSVAFDANKLLEVLNGSSNSPSVHYDADTENVTFTLATPDRRLTEENIDVCLDVFIEQAAQYCENIEIG